ncbi:MAG: 4a-hydroxytetrahydrobiopterin dehydratase [Candidatus Marinimicrobia bacterium]|nr:4a-hydroxytetrahydrobiopterin dehydratase [Candidatus Neomarinimicrobiota bacterium]MBT3936365.1 4a-hydroxytetrahydrobiopterin dehydratase [Candidatus Neomarinimicrobiota bacterium]MBT3960317.1 4a-hydroxytetrahydrobiopterin dehydratase [Candidatus Neomarinimicrobiota bacterium]MBT4383405.1 4a-hydroxytetrahydrobiopterin dehydratase [Candidatus Neomarinimicrobiota bacterium]MBT4635418.1 4a-hydroxytetrahydrobiopterin dehydratase [Candidatus Neomarinimicrobiota bacterium]
MSLASKQEIQSALTILDGWEYHDGKISKELTFNSYMEGIEFVNILAVKAEEVNHHPDLEISWCRVKVTYTSHDQGGVTQQCISMAKMVEDFLLI